MVPELALLLLLVLSLLQNAIVQVGVCRYLPRQGWLKSFFAGFAVGYVLLAVAGFALLVTKHVPPAEAAALFVTVSIAYAACGFFYFNIVNGGKSALRVRLLMELEAAPDGLTMEEMLDRYRPEEMYETRIGRMTGHGQVLLDGGRLRIGRPAMITISRLVFLAKRVVLGKASEFD